MHGGQDGDGEVSVEEGVSKESIEEEENEGVAEVGVGNEATEDSNHNDFLAEDSSIH